MEETLVFIDAGFLSKLSKHFGNGKYLTYDIMKFSELLSKKEMLKLKQVFYYTAPPFQNEKPSEEQKQRKDKYDRFIRKLSQNKGIIIREGRCQRLQKTDKEEIYKQKAVDTLAIIDLMSVPLKYPLIKKIILILCDSDFVPVIKNLEGYGIKTILYTYYEKGRSAKFSTSNDLIKSVNKYILLTKHDFDNAPLNTN